MRVRRTSIVVFFALSLAGCGGGSPSKAAYIAKGDAVCKDASAQVDQLGQPPKSTDSKAIADFLDKGAALAQRSLDRLSGLDRPAGDTAQLKAIFTARQQAVDKIKQAAQQARAGNLRAASTTISQVNAKAVDAMLMAYGFKVCGTPGS